MLDLKFIRDNAEMVREVLSKRKDNAPLDDILRLDAERKDKLLKLEELRHERKEAAKNYKANMAAGKEGVGRDMRAEIQQLEEETKAIDTQLNDLLLQMPNMLDPSVPIGAGEADNIVAKTWGEQPNFDFTAAPHWELAEKLGIIDFDRGVKLSGSRFYILKGVGARLQRALISLFLDIHTSKQGYMEIYPPYMVKKECMYASGNLPKFADNLYHDAEEDYWFVPTAEVPLTSLHRDEILPAANLPLYYTAYTACFRREKMSAGKDTRGIKRGHQFDKVEMYKFVTPETSTDELEKLVADAEEVCRALKLPYRLLRLCSAELGFASMKSYDIEIWSPGIKEWLEVSSCSNCGDFQARRANIRYRPAPDSKLQFVHTLNGSGLALPRVMIAILENYQQKDGTIRVPEVLQPFVKQEFIKGP